MTEQTWIPRYEELIITVHPDKLVITVPCRRWVFTYSTWTVLLRVNSDTLRCYNVHVRVA